jgi:hypothetical protein
MHVQDDFLGIILLVFSLICLGTWPALLRLGSCQKPNASKIESGRLLSPLDRIFCQCFATRDERRNVCHVYLDYSFAYVLVSSIPYIVSLFETDVSQQRKHPIIAVAMLGGSLLSFGNLSFQWATVVFGAPLTTVLSLQASLTVILGTSINYWIDPSLTSRPSMLFGGVVIFLVAISFATLAQTLYVQECDYAIWLVDDRFTETELEEMEQHEVRAPSFGGEDDGVVVAEQYNFAGASSERQWNVNSYQLYERSHINSLNPLPGPSQESNGDRKDAHWAVVVAIAGGICFGFFSPAFNISVNDPFRWTTNNVDPDNSNANQDVLVVEANFWFSLAFCWTSVLGNGVLMWRQRLAIQGRMNCSDAIRLWTAYFCRDSWIDRQLAFTAGAVCALGNVLQFKGGQRVGYATSDIVQAYPLVSSLWDVYLFGEFRNVKLQSKVFWLLIGMHTAYLSGVFLLAGSSVVP